MCIGQFGGDGCHLDGGGAAILHGGLGGHQGGRQGGAEVAWNVVAGVSHHGDDNICLFLVSLRW